VQGAFVDEHAMLESGSFAADSDASRLMDDLFQDLDQLLGVERGTLASRPPEPVFAPASVATAASPIGQPDQQKIDSADSESLSSSSLVPFPESALPQVEPATESGELSDITESAVAATEAIAQSAPQERSQFSVGSYDRLLLGIGCISVIVTLALWLFYQDRHRPAAPVAVAPATTAASPSSQDASRFADYVQKSLQNIDQQQASTTAPDSATTTGKMPTVNIPATTAPPAGTAGTSQPATGLSRIYVPVYEFPSNFTPPGTAIAPLPGAPRKTTLPPGSVRPSPDPNTASTLPSGTKPSVLPSVQPNQIPSPAVAIVSRKLVGVLDQGNRSAALFEVNGVTQRYEIGESIGSSGWTLVEVSKDQALIRRNGEVRSLFVGHSF
jgi:hypothetical protein